MMLVLSNPSLDISNLIISDITPAQFAPTHFFDQYFEAMFEIEDPANGIKTREQAGKILEPLDKVISPLYVFRVIFKLCLNPGFATQPTSAHQPDASRTTVKFQIPISLIKHSIDALDTFPFSTGNGHKWAGRTLVVKGTRSL